MGIKLVEARDEEGIRKGREVSLLLSTPVCQEVLRQLQYPLWLTTLVSTGPLLCALLSLGHGTDGAMSFTEEFFGRRWHG